MMEMEFRKLLLNFKKEWEILRKMLGLKALESVSFCVNRGCLYIENKGRKCVSNDYIFTLTDSHSICRNWFGRPNDSQMFTTDEQFSRPKLVRYAK